jgi:hypothetical protein
MFVIHYTAQLALDTHHCHDHLTSRYTCVWYGDAVAAAPVTPNTPVHMATVSTAGGAWLNPDTCDGGSPTAVSTVSVTLEHQ